MGTGTRAGSGSCRSLTECDQRLTRYRAARAAGTDPALIARWTAEVNAQRIMAHWVNDRPGYRCRHGQTSTTTTGRRKDQ
ncbi:MAG: hypothetical protein QG597_2370 [Actinomycetota bacterium]|nr:hypothetical protein [Actinomycetota bacterium]